MRKLFVGVSIVGCMLKVLKLDGGESSFGIVVLFPKVWLKGGALEVVKN